MTRSDIGPVIALSDRVHPSFREGEAMFADRLDLFPQGCLVLPRVGEGLAGYAIAYPAPFASPPPLDTVLGTIPPDADTLYIHDVAIAPEWRGARLAEPAIRHLLALTKDFSGAMLVSVYGTAPFWSRFGFRASDEPSIREKLVSYGEGAVFMVRPTP